MCGVIWWDEEYHGITRDQKYEYATVQKQTSSYCYYFIFGYRIDAILFKFW